jgi:nicotinamide-nucleotide amidase
MPADPAERLAEALQDRDETFAAAESCTGGLVGAELTSIPGASDWYAGGVIAYMTRVKRDLLGVGTDALDEHGAVSEPVARAMARGAIRVVDADWGVSTTGYAGPEGGPEAPVGTLVVGVARAVGEEDAEVVAVGRHRIQGARNAARRRMAGEALGHAADAVEGA